MLSNLFVSLGHHLSYAGSVWKYGTLLYHTNGELHSLTVSLHRLSSMCGAAQQNPPEISDTATMQSDHVKHMDDLNSNKSANSWLVMLTQSYPS